MRRVHREIRDRIHDIDTEYPGTFPRFVRGCQALTDNSLAERTPPQSEMSVAETYLASGGTPLGYARENSSSESEDSGDDGRD